MTTEGGASSSIGAVGLNTSARRFRREDSLPGWLFDALEKASEIWLATERNFSGPSSWSCCSFRSCFASSEISEVSAARNERGVVTSSRDEDQSALVTADVRRAAPDPCTAMILALSNQRASGWRHGFDVANEALCAETSKPCTTSSRR